MYQLEENVLLGWSLLTDFHFGKLTEACWRMCRRSTRCTTQMRACCWALQQAPARPSVLSWPCFACFVHTRARRSSTLRPSRRADLHLVLSSFKRPAAIARCVLPGCCKSCAGRLLHYSSSHSTGLLALGRYQHSWLCNLPKRLLAYRVQMLFTSSRSLPEQSPCTTFCISTVGGQGFAEDIHPAFRPWCASASRTGERGSAGPWARSWWSSQVLLAHTWCLHSTNSTYLTSCEHKLRKDVFSADFSHFSM